MKVDKFKWKTMHSPNGGEKMSITEVKFNDGYSQIWSSGINKSNETWDLSYTGHCNELAEIRQFLNSHIIHSFQWVNPWGEERLYRVQNESIKSEFISSNVVKLSFTFVQSYAP
ncbi:phage tail protein [Gilliamella sp. wkB308]|uniref:phage tail protein n=1 Tax=Gilliamella sp. wkB308 TaxID=3120263 RepID=UPI00080E091B|nr:phage tail protein [Gilliamella apicola]OCF95085.1 hypothetical protein A9G10_12405 [Gilliamella apicola]